MVQVVRFARRMSLVSVLAAIVLPQVASAQQDDWKIAWWDAQRKGANVQNEKPREGYWQAAGELGLDYVRILPDALPREGKDFLIGDADSYRAISERDLAILIGELDAAERNGVKVVLTMVGLPGARWRQLNNDTDDGRLWREERYQQQAIAFWRDLASRLKSHPAVVAYNPLNEPHPDKEYGYEAGDERFPAWYESVKGTTPDVNRFNRRIVAAIREEDPRTPILLDGWFHADPKGFDYLEPVGDSRILYAFHNPGPWQMCAYRANKGRYSYPDRVPGTWDGPGERWDRARLAEELAAVERWAARHGVAANRIVASEFWCDRRVEGAAAYMADLIDLYNERNWHWSFYAFRGDGSWTGLDYELGTGPGVAPGYWEAAERGEDVEHLKRRGPNELWEVIARQLRN